MGESSDANYVLHVGRAPTDRPPADSALLYGPYSPSAVQAVMLIRHACLYLQETASLTALACLEVAEEKRTKGQ